jgi:hypothetical protein
MGKFAWKHNRFLTLPPVRGGGRTDRAKKKKEDGWMGMENVV